MCDRYENSRERVASVCASLRCGQRGCSTVKSSSTDDDVEVLADVPQHAHVRCELLERSGEAPPCIIVRAVGVTEVQPEVALRIDVGDQNSISATGHQPACVGRQRGLAHASLPVDDGYDALQRVPCDGFSAHNPHPSCVANNAHSVGIVS